MKHYCTDNYKDTYSSVSIIAHQNGGGGRDLIGRGLIWFVYGAQLAWWFKRNVFVSRQATTCRVTSKWSHQPSDWCYCCSVVIAQREAFRALLVSNDDIYFMAAVNRAGSAVTVAMSWVQKNKNKTIDNLMRLQTALRHKAVQLFPLFIRDKEQYKILNNPLNSKSR